MLLEKLNTFVDGKYDVTVTAQQIVEEYEAKRGDSAEQIEGLAITQKFISTCKVLSLPYQTMAHRHLSEARSPEPWLIPRRRGSIARQISFIALDRFSRFSHSLDLPEEEPSTATAILRHQIVLLCSARTVYLSRTSAVPATSCGKLRSSCCCLRR